MATTIQIKRRVDTAEGGQLKAGELAYNFLDKKLYIGNAAEDDNIMIVGGEGNFSDYLALTGGTMTGAITLPSALPSNAFHAAHKTYVDTKLAKAGGTMTGFIELHANPTSAFHAATKQYVDNLVQGLDIRESCQLATTADITGYNGGAFSPAPTIIDGITLGSDQDGWRVLVKDQEDKSENGIYVYSYHITTPTLVRADDFGESAMTNGTIDKGIFIFVEDDGTVNKNKGFVLTTFTGFDSIIEWTQFSGAGAVAQELNDLGDVSLTTPANQDIMIYDSASSRWINLGIPVNPSGSEVLNVNIGEEVQWRRLHITDISNFGNLALSSGYKILYTDGISSGDGLQLDAGSMIYGGTNGIPTKLAGSSGNKFLKAPASIGGKPSWSAITISQVMPDPAHNNDLLSVNSGGTGFNYIDIGAANTVLQGGVGAASFAQLALSQLSNIASMSGAAGKIAIVNANANGLDFTDTIDCGSWS